MPLTIEVEQEDDCRWLAEVPDLLGVLCYGSVRVGTGYRALAVNGDDGPVWFWIGSHAEYDRILRGS